MDHLEKASYFVFWAKLFSAWCLALSFCLAGSLLLFASSTDQVFALFLKTIGMMCLASGLILSTICFLACAFEHFLSFLKEKEILKAVR